MNKLSKSEETNILTSPLLMLPDQLDAIIMARTNNLGESIDSFLTFADQLSQFDNETAKSRAAFIRMQCTGIETEDFFEQHRQSWGIPKFEEGLITTDDFKNGFLFTFRDHSTSWCEDIEAREWFFKSIEARFVRHYQFWACDNGPEEVMLSASGNYKSIMWTIVNDFQDYTALASPVFTKHELQVFYRDFDEEKGDYSKEELLEMIEENPNW